MYLPAAPPTGTTLGASRHNLTQCSLKTGLRQFALSSLQRFYHNPRSGSEKQTALPIVSLGGRCPHAQHTDRRRTAQRIATSARGWSVIANRLIACPSCSEGQCITMTFHCLPI